MSDKTVVENADRERSQRGDDEGDRDVASPSGIEGQSSGRRHFTPIYENFDQAYTSITGGDPSSQFGTPTPGTESLNNVYASGAASVLPSAADQTAHVASGSVSLPFQRSISPDDDEHMMVGRHAQLEGDRGDNPAGMQLASTDVALQPIMRNVRRGIATPISPLQREASSVMFDCDDRGIRDRSSSMPVRAPTPYPDLESGPHSGNESTIGNIVERYGGSDDSLLPTVGSERSRPGYSSSSGDTAPADATGVGRVYTQPRVRHNTALVGAPPSWPLPSEVSGSSETMGRNVTQLSSSPPTYGTTAGLLNISRQRTSAHGESPLDPINPFGPPPRSSSVYSSDLDEMLARRGRSTTPFDQIGEPGPAIASSPRPTSPAIQLLPQPLANDFDIPSRSNQTEARASIDEPSSSSGIGIALTGSEDPIVRFEQGDRTSTAFEEAIDTNDADDDAAWSTTQEGTNTQRNSAVPYVDLANATSSSSLGRQVVSAWDPLALRNEDEGTYRENAELVHLRRHNTLGEVQTIIPESSAEIASPRQRRQTGPRTSTSLALSGSEQTITPTLHNIGQNSGTLYQPTIPGNTLLLRTPRIISHPSETIVDMSATSSREDHAANNRALRMAELEDLIRRYEPRADDAPPRQQWPEARLTTDRRILEAENNEEFVRRQRGLTRTLLFLSIPFYIFTFPFVNSLATNGPVARNVLLWFSLRGGGPINNVHREDMALAERVELLLLGAVGVAMAAIFGGLVALLCGAW
ncbi:uncharacterized protein HMPREF1541_00492 [Cyphellophora europaea CBS 101466]|uniref:Uncharacterized protein n=1 Tax=Cyphellophora europaea (strain CBS 101466) TaxID=1220924 RepID=W2SE35_CYPE1|nr:uncharacterized protein HMPREF1541_00492 [Cyphellophora europaea CBS 101466]ETN46308.1 hypothetical protein HMPREF1541_00492 [Cyphellophora europaea CBS 101466]